jgi:hypothetical protein
MWFVFIMGGLVAIAICSGLWLKAAKNWHQAGEMDRVHGGFSGMLDE